MSIDKQDENQLIQVRKKVLEEISDVRVDNNLPAVYVEEIKNLDWSPKYLIIPEGSGRFSTGDENCSFRQLKKKSDEILNIQKKINRDIFFDEIGGVQKACYGIYSEAKKKLGFKVKTLDDLFQQEHALVGDMRTILSQVHSVCAGNYHMIKQHRTKGNKLLSELLVLAPAQKRELSQINQDYENALRQLAKTDYDDPRYPELSDKVLQLRDAVQYGSGKINNTQDEKTLRRQAIMKIDTAAQILITGITTIESLSIRYKIAHEFLEIWPALVNIRNLFKYVTTMSNMNSAIVMTLQQANQIQGNLQNPHLLARVYNELPEYNQNGGMVTVLDRLNKELAYDKNKI